MFSIPPDSASSLTSIIQLQKSIYYPFEVDVNKMQVFICCYASSIACTIQQRFNLLHMCELQSKMKAQKNFYHLDNFLKISIAVNFLSLLIVAFMIYKYQQLKKIKSSSKMSEVSSSSVPEVETQDRNPPRSGVFLAQNPYGKRENVLSNTEVQTDKIKIRLFSESENKENQNEGLQVSIKQFEKNTVEISLKQQLELQQERNKYLQEKIVKMEEEMNRANQAISPNRGKITRTFATEDIDDLGNVREELSNLKNELDFCQKKLVQSYETQKELKGQIEIYQKMGGTSLPHNELSRLREMNLKYKQIINNMQTCLLEGQPRNMYFSFIDEQRGVI